MFRPEVLEQFIVLSGQLYSLNEEMKINMQKSNLFTNIQLESSNSNNIFNHMVIFPLSIDPNIPNQGK